MTAKDYEFFPAAISGNIYLAKKTKKPHVMSQDRRVVTENEIIGMFEHYLRHFCEENDTDTLVITGEDGKVCFTATLKDFKPQND